MHTNTLYESLMQACARNESYIITFTDGDSYRLRDIDFCYSVDRDGQRENEPLRVDFENCIDDSRRYRLAVRDGPENSTHVWWMSTGDREPVGVDYAPADVSTVFDDERQYFVYDASSAVD